MTMTRGFSTATCRNQAFGLGPKYVMLFHVSSRTVSTTDAHRKSQASPDCIPPSKLGRRDLEIPGNGSRVHHDTALGNPVSASLRHDRHGRYASYRVSECVRSSHRDNSGSDMAGCGTDIRLGFKEWLRPEGLYVIGTNRQEAFASPTNCAAAPDSRVTRDARDSLFPWKTR